MIHDSEIMDHALVTAVANMTWGAPRCALSHFGDGMGPTQTAVPCAPQRVAVQTRDLLAAAPVAKVPDQQRNISCSPASGTAGPATVIGGYSAMTVRGSPISPT